MPDEINDVMVVWELRGNYPEIATFEDVDIAGLTAGDDNPVYITLPIGQSGSTSRNKNHYDEAFVQELARQTQMRKPVGIMGHKKGGDMEWPEDDVHWVGMKFEDGQLWGKAYVSSEEARKRVRLYKSTNKPIATSIYAHMGRTWDPKLGAHRADAKSLDLHRIDLGPLDMAGVQSLAKVPHVTAEMVNDNNEEITSMDKLTIIRELTAADADLLPTTVKDAVMATAQTPPEVALVTEMRQELGDGDMLAVIRELKQEKEQRAKTAVVERITELVNDEEKGIKMTSARSIVMELVKARNPQTVDEADAAYDEVVKTEAVTEMLKSAVQSKGGPALRIGLQSQNGKSVDQWFPLPTTNGGK